MATSLTNALVGREREFRVLRGELDAALGGETRIAFLLGEAGIGKTRTAATLAEEARSLGAGVAWGRGHEGIGAPVYRPWIQLLTSLETICPEPLRARTVAAKEALQSDASSVVGESSPEQARFAVFERVCETLAAVATERPLVLVFDDLQWLDVASLRLLDFLTRELIAVPLLIVGTLRDGEALSASVPMDLIPKLLGVGRSVNLRGLSDDAVSVLLSETLERAASVELVEHVQGATAGNPFLVIEFANLIATSDTAVNPTGVPAGARSLLLRRLSSLSLDEQRVVDAGAVAGLEFDLTLIAHVLDEPEERILADLESIAARGLVREVDGALHRFAFAHALLRETSYGSLSAQERMSLHAATARALETLQGDHDSRLPLLAHHYFEAAKGGETAQAIAYCMAAGERALAQLAFEDAIQHFERALSALTYASDRNHWRVLSGLAQAVHGTGDHPGARALFERSISIARDETPESFGSAVLRFSSAEAETLVLDLDVNRLLEEALSGLPPDPTPLRTLLLARLAWGIQLAPDNQVRSRLMSEKAAELARAMRDPKILDFVLTTRLRGLLGPDDGDVRRATIEEILEHASSPSAELDGLRVKIGDCAERGDRAGLDDALATYEMKARAHGQPYFLWGVARANTAIALMEGRFDDAEASAHEARRIGEKVLSRSPALEFAQQIFQLRGWQNRLAEIEPFLKGSLQEAQVVPGWRCALAIYYSVSGRDAEARREFDFLVAANFEDIPRDATWLVSMKLLAELCHRLDDEPRAEMLYDRLLPYAGRISMTWPIIVLESPIDLPLAGLAITLRRFEEAADHLDRAREIARRMRAVPWLAEIAYFRAVLMSRRAAPGDDERALTFLDEADAIAAPIGMDLIVDWVAQFRRELTDSPNVRLGPESTERARTEDPRRGKFRREGQMWTIEFDGRTTHYKPMLGLSHIARLLGTSGDEIHVSDLAALASREDVSGPTGDAGERLDAQARSEYERRLRDAAEELEEAERINDLGRIERLQEEMEQIRREVARGFGLGGRSRRDGSAQERARVAVTRTIKYAIDKIAAEDPALSDHLRASIKTGTFASYQPTARDAVDWEF